MAAFRHSRHSSALRVAAVTSFFLSLSISHFPNFVETDDMETGLTSSLGCLHRRDDGRRHGLDGRTSDVITMTFNAFSAAGYCRQLKADCRDLQKEADALRTELQSLSAEINTYHTELPADGVQSQATSSITTQQMFNNYVYARTATNWKFWIFGLFIRPLFESYDRAVVTTNCDDFYRSALKWLQDHCNLLSLRKVIHSAVLHVARRTSVINLPENLPKEAMEAAIKDVSETNGGQSSTSAATSENGHDICGHLR